MVKKTARKTKVATKRVKKSRPVKSERTLLAALVRDFRRTVRLFDQRITELEKTVATMAGSAMPIGDTGEEAVHASLETVDESEDEDEVAYGQEDHGGEDDEEFDESIHDA